MTQLKYVQDFPYHFLSRVCSLSSFPAVFTAEDTKWRLQAWRQVWHLLTGLLWFPFPPSRKWNRRACPSTQSITLSPFPFFSDIVAFKNNIVAVLIFRHSGTSLTSEHWTSVPTAVGLDIVDSSESVARPVTLIRTWSVCHFSYQDLEHMSLLKRGLYEHF